jgi:Xaa-Pro aminopeptidase
MVDDCGLSKATIGTDLGVMRKETYDGLRAALPDCAFVDVSDILYDLRKIKLPEEIRRLRNAAALFDTALADSMKEVRQDTMLADLRANFDGAAIAALRREPSLGQYQGTFGFNSIGAGDVNRVRPGDIIKIDAGIRLDGYWSDCARVFCYGDSADEHVRIHEALLAGFEAAEAVMKPGATMREVYTVALETVRGLGFPNYSRGHFGHSIGLDDQIEEPPFIGPNDTLLEAGMVLCLELPYYPVKLGGFNIEEVFLITPDGAESLNSSPRSLLRLPL